MSPPAFRSRSPSEWRWPGARYRRERWRAGVTAFRLMGLDPGSVEPPILVTTWPV